MAMDQDISRVLFYDATMMSPMALHQRHSCVRLGVQWTELMSIVLLIMEIIAESILSKLDQSYWTGNHNANTDHGNEGRREST